MFCELFAFGFPPKPYALAARLALLERRRARRLDDRRASTGIRPLIGEALARGGNIPVGLDDAPFRSPMSNLDWVEAAVRTVRDHGSGTRLGSRGGTGARVDRRRCLTTYFCLLRTGCPQSGSPAALFCSRKCKRLRFSSIRSLRRGIPGQLISAPSSLTCPRLMTGESRWRGRAPCHRHPLCLVSARIHNRRGGLRWRFELVNRVVWRGPDVSPFTSISGHQAREPIS